MSGRAAEDTGMKKDTEWKKWAEDVGTLTLRGRAEKGDSKGDWEGTARSRRKTRQGGCHSSQGSVLRKNSQWWLRLQGNGLDRNWKAPTGLSNRDAQWFWGEQVWLPQWDSNQMQWFQVSENWRWWAQDTDDTKKFWAAGRGIEGDYMVMETNIKKLRIFFHGCKEERLEHV